MSPSAAPTQEDGLIPARACAGVAPATIRCLEVVMAAKKKSAKKAPKTVAKKAPPKKAVKKRAKAPPQKTPKRSAAKAPKKATKKSPRKVAKSAPAKRQPRRAPAPTVEVVTGVALDEVTEKDARSDDDE
jgi:hypothetical protein